MKALTRTLAAGLISIVTLLSCSTPALAATTPVFDDVPETHWAHSYISQAASNGWIAGYGGGLFGPADNVTYAALSQMLDSGPSLLRSWRRWRLLKATPVQGCLHGR